MLSNLVCPSCIVLIALVTFNTPVSSGRGTENNRQSGNNIVDKYYKCVGLKPGSKLKHTNNSSILEHLLK